MLEPRPDSESCDAKLPRRSIRAAEKLARLPGAIPRKLRATCCAMALGLLALGLGACAEQKAPATAMAVASTPGGVTGDFEVVYRGASTRYRADDRNCPSPGLVTLRPAQGAFTYRLGGRVRIETTIIGDGTLVGEGEGYTLTGTATDQKIEGEVKSGRCAYHFRAFRKS